MGGTLKPPAPAETPASPLLTTNAPVRSVVGVGVVRPVSAPNPSRPGSLRLTGRLVDVCAELERLARAEAVADAMALRA